MHRVGVVGTGYVGLPLATLLSRVFPVVGFDVDRAKVAQLREGNSPLEEPGLSEALKTQLATSRLRFSDDVVELSTCDVKILTVGTPYDSAAGEVDYSQLDRAVELVGPRLARNDVLVIKSTVPPGTTEGRVAKAVQSYGFGVPDDVGLAFSPERIVEGQALRDFATLPKIIGATDDRTFGITREILGTMGGSVRRVSSPTAAELMKLVDNYARYVFLGLTNELALMSEKVGVDVFELIDAAKFEYPRNAGILVPGPGVGGSCLNKDPFILASLMVKKRLELVMGAAASRVNQSIPSHVVSLVERYAGVRRRVVIGGIAFKRDTDDTRFTPIVEIGDLLRRNGFSVVLADPFARLGGERIERDLLAAAKSAEILVLITDHSVYRSIPLRELKEVMERDPLIVDTRGFFDRDEAIRVGFEYHGYGRL